MEAGKKKPAKGAGRGGGKQGGKPRKAIKLDDDGFNLSDNLPQPPPPKIGFDAGTSVFVTKHRPSILDMKKKKKPPKKPAKKPTEGSKISAASSIAPDVASMPALSAAVTKHSETVSQGRVSPRRMEQVTEKSSGKAREPLTQDEKQPPEGGGREQSHLTQSHPWTSILAPSGGATVRQNQTVCWYMVYVVSAFVIVVLAGVAVFLMVLMWRKHSRKAAVSNATTSTRPRHAQWVLST